MLSIFSMSRMLSRTAAVLMSTSHAGMRPALSERGTSRSDTTACSALASEKRTSACWCGG